MGKTGMKQDTVDTIGKKRLQPIALVVSLVDR